MKRIYLILTALVLSLGFTNSAFAQRGTVGLGLRATPDGGGFTGKFFLDRNLALEGQLNAGGLLGWVEGHSFTAVGLVEYHVNFPDPAWSLFFGGGAHAGVWNHDYRVYNPGEGRYINENSETIFGLDGIGGVEYRFRRIPLGLSADFKPAVNFVGNVEFFPHNLFGLSARVYF